MARTFGPPAKAFFESTAIPPPGTLSWVELSSGQQLCSRNEMSWRLKPTSLWRKPTSWRYALETLAANPGNEIGSRYAREASTLLALTPGTSPSKYWIAQGICWGGAATRALGTSQAPDNMVVMAFRKLKANHVLSCC